MRPARPSPTQASVERLLGDGLDRYRYGDYDGAIETWERALALDPDEYRAAAWVEFVRAHHDALLGAEPVAEHLVPFGLAGSEDGADYQIEIEYPTERLAEPAVADGWGLSAELGATATIELDADEPGAAAAPSAGELFGDDDDATTDYASLSLGPARPRPAVSDDSGEATLGHYRGQPPGPLELDLELGPALPSPPPRHDFASREASAEVTLERAAHDHRRTEPGGLGPPIALPFVAPPPAAAPSSAGLAISELTLDLDPTAAALELGIEASVPSEPPPPPPRSATIDLGIAVEELRLPPPPRPLAPVDNDDDHPARPAAVPAGVLAAQLLAEVDRERRPGESTDDIARRRISLLIERARTAAARDERDVVAVALDLALAESPDSAVAQKLIHRHRDVVLDCYYRYLGALDRRPALAAALTKDSGAGLDPRAAFLLSRIDGMMTYDELLDVAGMGRLEACRHLVALVGRGLVRTT